MGAMVTERPREVPLLGPRVIVQHSRLWLGWDDVEDLVTGAAVIRDGHPFGPEIPHRLTREERREWEKACNRGYVLVAPDAYTLRNAFHAACEARRRPFVAVTREQHVWRLSADLGPSGAIYEGFEQFCVRTLKRHSHSSKFEVGRVNLSMQVDSEEKACDLATFLLREIPKLPRIHRQEWDEE